MEFTIENGTNICAIGLSDVGSYIRFRYPLTVVWNDNRGSVGKYFCILPYNEDYRTTVKNKINDSLTKDFSENVEALYILLAPLLPIFKNGDYSLTFYANKEKEFFQYRSSIDNLTEIHYARLEIVFAEETTDSSNIDRVRAEYRQFLKDGQAAKRQYYPSILEHTTSGIYDGWQSLYATQPAENIDQDRVKYFEEMIKNGERPFALLFNAYLPSEDFDSSYFILDGHHKLLAYERLGLYPPVALITHLPKDTRDTEFDAEQLAAALYPWQIEHILAHWDGKDKYIEQTLKNPDSNLHTIIKNGDYEEYHENGKLKHKAIYINDKVDGCAKYWHDNGQLKSEQYYDKGQRKGTWKDYFRSGQIEFIQPFNDAGRYEGTLVSYYENGGKRIEQQLKNDQNIDGVSYKAWFETGDREAELTYKNGIMIVRKNWNSWGECVNHEVYNEETGRLEKAAIAPEEKYDYHSVNYRNRQREIRAMLQGRRNYTPAKKEQTATGFWERIKRFFR